MNILARATRTAGGTAMRVTVGSVCRAAAAVAVLGLISVFSIAELSRAYFSPTIAMDPTHQPQLNSLLCRIDRRCRAMDLTYRSTPRSETGGQAGALLDRADKAIE